MMPHAWWPWRRGTAMGRWNSVVSPGKNLAALILALLRTAFLIPGRSGIAVCPTPAVDLPGARLMPLPGVPRVAPLLPRSRRSCAGGSAGRQSPSGPGTTGTITVSSQQILAVPGRLLDPEVLKPDRITAPDMVLEQKPDGTTDPEVDLGQETVPVQVLALSLLLPDPALPSSMRIPPGRCLRS